MYQMDHCWGNKAALLGIWRLCRGHVVTEKTQFKSELCDKGNWKEMQITSDVPLEFTLILNQFHLSPLIILNNSYFDVVANDLSVSFIFSSTSFTPITDSYLFPLAQRLYYVEEGILGGKYYIVGVAVEISELPD